MEWRYSAWIQYLKSRFQKPPSAVPPVAVQTNSSSSSLKSLSSDSEKRWTCVNRLFLSLKGYTYSLG